MRTWTIFDEKYAPFNWINKCLDFHILISRGERERQKKGQTEGAKNKRKSMNVGGNTKDYYELIVYYIING